MGTGTFEKLLASLNAVGAELPDWRCESRNRGYELLDGIKSAFAVFFFQHPSLLDFQRKMEGRRRRNNVETLLGVEKIPSDNQIRALVDGIDPAAMSGAFDSALRIADDAGALEPYRVLDGGVLLALDGLWHFSSEKVGCGRCLTKKSQDGRTVNYHAAVAGAIVRPGSNAVLPVMPEPIRNGDGGAKQDCEREAGKRWLEAHGKEYARLKPTLLGDDLYSNQPFCEAALRHGMGFIFTCKPDSHPWLSETVGQSFLEEHTERKWTGRNRQASTYRWMNGVPLRDSRDALMVNYLRLEVVNEDTGKKVYANSWVTDKELTAENAAHIASCGRARWKIENEHNNVLKNRGYNLGHNFGHGKNHACETFMLLNLLAFAFHTILELCDEDYRKARASFGRRDSYFHHMQAALRYALHESWRDFMLFVMDEDGEPDEGG